MSELLIDFCQHIGLDENIANDYIKNTERIFTSGQCFSIYGDDPKSVGIGIYYSKNHFFNKNGSLYKFLKSNKFRKFSGQNAELSAILVALKYEINNLKDKPRRKIVIINHFKYANDLLEICDLFKGNGPLNEEYRSLDHELLIEISEILDYFPDRIRFKNPDNQTTNKLITSFSNGVDMAYDLANKLN